MKTNTEADMLRWKHASTATLDEQPVEMTEEQWKQHATQKSLDIVESLYNILKARDAEIERLRKPVSVSKVAARAKVDRPTVYYVLEAAGVRYHE